MRPLISSYFRVQGWLPYLEGHNEMSEMKLSLQVQLDSHVFQTCRGREKMVLANKDTCQSLHLNFAKALHSVGMRLFSLPHGSVWKRNMMV